MLGSPPRSKSTYSTQLFTMAGHGEEAAVRGGVRKGPAHTCLALHLCHRVHTVQYTADNIDGDCEEAAFGDGIRKGPAHTCLALHLVHK